MAVTRPLTASGGADLLHHVTDTFMSALHDEHPDSFLPSPAM